MLNASASPEGLIRSLYRNRNLIFSLATREVVGRYRGSALGLLWSFFNPIFLLVVYTFVFSVVFQARWGTGSGSRTEFALVLFAGLIVFNFFSECINKAPGLILGNVNYVKKVVFPIEILPCVSALAAVFHTLISVIVWLLAYLIFFGMPHITVLLFPVVFLPIVFLVMGGSWFLASLGVYVRDVSQFIAILTTVLMFLSPIFYPATALPEKYQMLLMLNPLSIGLSQVRDVLFWGNVPSFTLFVVYFILTAIFACLGFAWFQKTRKGFADVI